MLTLYKLGVSLALNFLAWTYASRKDLDNWGALGNHNWSWDALQPFYKKIESLTLPSPETAEAVQTQYLEPALHGSQGSMSTTFADIYGAFGEAWPRTFDTLGLAMSSDPKDGLGLGGYTHLNTLDLETRSRSYAATTYLQEAIGRPNFRVITGAHVRKVLFDVSDQVPEATGVFYIVNGTTKELFVNR